MMSSNDLLLGFDAREMWLSPQDYWPDSRKKMYLLRDDVVRPLSTDTSVWRAVFDADTSLQRPPWTGPIQNLWDNLATLQEYMDTVWSERTLPSWIIAVTLQEDVCESEDLQEWYARASNIIPSLRDPAWAFLGYDVSDKWLLSGLSNCGYGTNESEIQILRDTYASDLNEHHLFDSIKPAVDFMHFSDERVQAHAPFFVFGIWLIKKEEGLAHPD
ncbi:MAG: hypothetical protein NVSMB27_46020 [Ktedonobacteraceae bacterium]